jgi:hypothetical protein
LRNLAKNPAAGVSYSAITSFPARDRIKKRARFFAVPTEMDANHRGNYFR